MTDIIITGNSCKERNKWWQGMWDQVWLCTHTNTHSKYTVLSPIKKVSEVTSDAIHLCTSLGRKHKSSSLCHFLRSTSDDISCSMCYRWRIFHFLRKLILYSVISINQTILQKTFTLLWTLVQYQAIHWHKSVSR
jgi:hypothetical protein